MRWLRLEPAVGRYDWDGTVWASLTEILAASFVEPRSNARRGVRAGGGDVPCGVMYVFVVYCYNLLSQPTFGLVGGVEFSIVHLLEDFLSLLKRAVVLALLWCLVDWGGGGRGGGLPCVKEKISLSVLLSLLSGRGGRGGAPDVLLVAGRCLLLFSPRSGAGGAGSSSSSSSAELLVAAGVAVGG